MKTIARVFTQPIAQSHPCHVVLTERLTFGGSCRWI